jgi:hypothetical protein
MASGGHRRAEDRRIPWNRWVLLLAFVWLVVSPITLSPAPPAAGSGPEPAHDSGAIGFDISYPQCPKLVLPKGDFGIVGLNHGRPFTVNDCSARLYRWAEQFGTPSLYLNVAFDRSYARHVTASCRAAVPTTVTGSRPRLAWAVGCSESAYSLARAPGPALWWWLDVETANSWGHADAVNRAAIDGAVWFLRQYADRPVGIYSSDRSWLLVTGFGPWNPSGATANWVGVSLGRTRASAPHACGVGFSGMPVTLVQFYRRTAGTVFDANYAC